MSRLLALLILVSLPGLALAGGPPPQKWQGPPAPKAGAKAKASASSRATASVAGHVGSVAVEGDDVDVPPGVSSFAFGECSSVGTAGWANFGVGIGGQNKLCELVLAMKMLEATGMHRVPCDPKSTQTCAYSPEYLELASKAHEVATARTGWPFTWLRKIPIVAWFL
jgi:hypothetical protein